MQSPCTILVFALCVLSAVCGAKVAPQAQHGRIIGGSDARVAQFPFVAAIQARSPFSTHFCAGSLVGNQWIITSANCVSGAQSFEISMGSNLLNGTDINRIKVSSTTYFSHPDFNQMTLEHDIAIIKLHMAIRLTEYIQPLYLPTVEIAGGMTVLAVGWGQTSDSTPGPVDHLQFVSVTTLSLEECKLTYGNQVVDTMLCISGNYNEGTCVDDAGGALVTQLNQHNFHLGVSSFNSGLGCETPDPSGYTRTFAHIDWIKEITGL